MSEYHPEIETHPVAKGEREFYENFVKVLDYLHKRALKAEMEVLRLRSELEHRREQVEYYEKPNITAPVSVEGT